MASDFPQPVVPFCNRMAFKGMKRFQILGFQETK
jgi:hypothetical protein